MRLTSLRSKENPDDFPLDDLPTERDIMPHAARPVVIRQQPGPSSRPTRPVKSDMYTESHDFYDEAYSFKDYRSAAATIMERARRHCPRATTLLDVACGTGRHLEHFAQHYTCAGIDLNEHFLAKARTRCGNVQFHHANMIDFQLGRKFDVITLLFSSIAYVKYKANLIKTICNLEAHLGEEGLILVEPFLAPANYWTGTITANHVDRPNIKICWMYTSDPPVDNVATLNVKWMVGTPAGIRVFDEVHEFGLFSEEDWKSAFDAASLDYDYDPVGPMNRGLYTLRRRAR